VDRVAGDMAYGSASTIGCSDAARHADERLKRPRHLRECAMREQPAERCKNYKILKEAFHWTPFSNAPPTQ
jgi:hypothetical protein